MSNFEKTNTKEILNYLKLNRDDWKEEYFGYVRQNLWTEASFDEYSLFKTWCNFQTDNYFLEMQEAIEEEEGRKVPIATLKHDSWTIYKMQIGINRDDIIYKVITATQGSILNSIKTEGGIA